VHALVVKELKSAGGTPRTTAATSAIGQCRDGSIADDGIRKGDTAIVSISQFSFTPKQIRDKFGGDVNFLLRGTVTRVMKNEINIKFDGDHGEVCITMPEGRARAVREAPPEEGDDHRLLRRNLDRGVEPDYHFEQRMDGRRLPQLRL
jgi:hypothetical protein